MRKLTRRECLALGAGAALGAVGCRPDPNAGKTPLRYMAWGNVEQLAVEQRMVDLFNAANPDVHVRLFKVPQSAYSNKMTIMFASYTAPDVVRVDHYMFPNMVRKDYFADLTPFAEDDPDFDADVYFDAAMEECLYRDRLHGLNVLFGGGLLAFNKTMLDAEGLESPNALWDRGEWTWERLIEHSVAVTKRSADGRAEQFGLAMPYSPMIFSLVWSYGGDFVTPKYDRCLLDSPEAIEAFQLFTDLRWKHECTPSPSEGMNAAFGFETGKLGFSFEFTGAAPRYRDRIKNFEWDFAPLPLGPAGRGTFVKGNQLVMSARSEHKEAAWRFMKWLTSFEGERILYVDERRAAPSRRDIVELPEFWDTGGAPENMGAVIDTVEHGRTLPINDRWAEWTLVMNQNLDGLRSGLERDAEPVMRRITREVTKVLNEEPGF